MAAPAKIPLPANAWTKVATAVQFGVVYPENRERAALWYTYVQPTGGAAPVGLDGTEKPFTSDFAVISHDAPIDVYLYRANSSGECTVYL